MKVYKKIMNGLAFVEKLVLVLSTILIVVLTVGNVLSRKVLHQSWSFTEELVVAVFVLITLLAAALAARDGELVNLSLLPDRLSAKARRSLAKKCRRCWHAGSGVKATSQNECRMKSCRNRS